MLSQHCLQALVCALFLPPALGAGSVCCAWAWSQVTPTGEGPSEQCLSLGTPPASALLVE